MSNDDRALLEAAARAQGRPVHRWAKCAGVDVAVLDDGSYWQPLYENQATDCMGDALRLAIALHMTVARRENVNGAFAYAEVPGQMFCPEPLSGGAEPNAATRRAIVRAAAEAGGEHG